MFWSLLFNLVLIVLVIRICTSAFHYVRVSFFHHYLIPIYSLVMFLITMRWNKQDLILSFWSFEFVLPRSITFAFPFFIIT